MPYFIVLADQQTVLGLWEDHRDVAASRWGLELSLTYPRCSVMVRQAASLDELRARCPGLQFGDLQAEPLSKSRAPASSPAGIAV